MKQYNGGPRLTKSSVKSSVELVPITAKGRVQILWYFFNLIDGYLGIMMHIPAID